MCGCWKSKPCSLGSSLLHNGIVCHEDGKERYWSLITLETQIPVYTSVISLFQAWWLPLASDFCCIWNKRNVLGFGDYRKSVSSLQLLAWCTVKIFFSNGKNKPLHFSYVKLQILELWNEILQVTFHMSCHLQGALARTLEPRSCSKIQHLWKLTLSIFQFYLNSPCLFYTIADKVDSTNSAPIS